MARMASQRSTGKSSTGAVNWMPALFTRMSTGPRSRSVWASISAISPGFDMSAALYETARPGTAVISFFTAAIASREPNPLSITAAPCPASAPTPSSASAIQAWARLIQRIRPVSRSWFRHSVVCMGPPSFVRAPGLEGVLGDHPLLVGRDHPGGHGRARPRDARPASPIGSLVDVQPQPARARADARTNLRRVLADAGREHHRVDAVHRRRQRADLARHPVDEMVQREAGAWILAGEQIAHVVADTGQPAQPRALVEQLLDVLGAVALLRQEVQHHAGIELAAAGAHGQPVERGEAHGAVHAPAGLDRAHAGAAAKVANDHGAAGDVRGHRGEPPGDVFVRQPVEAVPPDPFLI